MVVITMESRVAGSGNCSSGSVSLSGNLSTASQALPQAASFEIIIITVKCGSATAILKSLKVLLAVREAFFLV